MCIPIITYRMQGVKASLFCTNGELQNSREHCGGHAVKVTIWSTVITSTVVSSYCIHSVEHTHYGLHQTQCSVDTHNQEHTAHLPAGKKGLDYYMLDDILLVVHILCTLVLPQCIVVLEFSIKNYIKFNWLVTYNSVNHYMKYVLPILIST